MQPSGNLGAYRKTVFNPTAMPLSWRWDSVYYVVAPGGTLTCPLFLAEHLLKHLRPKGLREASQADISSATQREFSEDQRDGVGPREVYGTPAPAAPVAPTVVAAPVVTPPAQPVQQTPPSVSSTGGTQEPTVFHCNFPDCKYTNEKESGVLMHQRTKHREVTYGK